jgi:opacity protein-like surface antigen
MLKRALVLLALVALLAAAASAVATAAQDHAKSHLEPVNGSGVHGKVQLQQLSSDGTRIHVLAKGLKPGKNYVSLYYDNDHCALEPYSEDDVIGGPYTANPGGIGHTSGTADDALDEINSVSVRSAKNFELLACAKVDH